MARSSTTVSFELRRRHQRYIWPDAAINIWILIMLATGGVLTGIFAQLTNVQNHVQVNVPWILPFGITVGALTIVFIFFLLILIATRRLIPSVVIILSFVLFALFLTGAIETAIQLFASGTDINNTCQNYVIGDPVYGQSINTLAWLEQQSICESWYAVFAFWIIGTVFLVWITFIAFWVNQSNYE